MQSQQDDMPGKEEEILRINSDCLIVICYLMLRTEEEKRCYPSYPEPGQTLQSPAVATSLDQYNNKMVTSSHHIILDRNKTQGIS